jgi:hypothetical protein
MIPKELFLAFEYLQALLALYLEAVDPGGAARAVASASSAAAAAAAGEGARKGGKKGKKVLLRIG